MYSGHPTLGHARLPWGMNAHHSRLLPSRSEYVPVISEQMSGFCSHRPAVTRILFECRRVYAAKKRRATDDFMLLESKYGTLLLAATLVRWSSSYVVPCQGGSTPLLLFPFSIVHLHRPTPDAVGLLSEIKVTTRAIVTGKYLSTKLYGGLSL